MGQILKADYTDNVEIFNKINLGRMLFTEQEEGLSSTLTIADNTAESINGVIYYTSGDVSIDLSGMSIVGQAYMYVYLCPDFNEIGVMTTEITEDAPTWDPAKSGYYLGIKKAIYKVFRIFDNISIKNPLHTIYDLRVAGRTDFEATLKTANAIKTSGIINGNYTGADIYNLLTPVFDNDGLYQTRIIKGFMHDILSNTTFVITHVNKEYDSGFLSDVIYLRGLQNFEITGTTIVTAYKVWPGHDTNLEVSLAW